jgi:hypothetical protein
MPPTAHPADELGTDPAGADEIGPLDELTTRRIVDSVLAEYRELVSDPERLARVDRDLDAIEMQVRALGQGPRGERAW